MEDRNLGFTEATVSIIDIWNTAKLRFEDDPKGFIDYMDNFFDVCALRILGMPVEEAQSFLEA